MPVFVKQFYTYLFWGILLSLTFFSTVAAQNVSVTLDIIPPPPPPNSRNPIFVDPGIPGGIGGVESDDDEDVVESDVVDEKAPTIVDVQIIELATSSAWVLWFTDEDTRATFRYGLTDEYELGTISFNLFASQHAVVIEGLQRGMKYYIKILAYDQADNEEIAEQFFTLLEAKDDEIEESPIIEKEIEEVPPSDPPLVDAAPDPTKRDEPIQDISPAPADLEQPVKARFVHLTPPEEIPPDIQIDVIPSPLEGFVIQEMKESKPVKETEKKEIVDKLETEQEPSKEKVKPGIIDTDKLSAMSMEIIRDKMIERRTPSVLGERLVDIVEYVLSNEIFDQRQVERVVNSLKRKVLVLPHVYSFPYVAPSYTVTPLIQTYIPTRVIFSLVGSTMLALYQPQLYYLFTLWQLL